MKLLTNFFSSAATKRPVITILVVLLLTGFFGYMAGQAEELSTSFGGELDTPEIQAQSKLGDYFQTSGSQSVFQIIMSCLLYTSPSPRDMRRSRMPSSA